MIRPLRSSAVAAVKDNLLWLWHFEPIGEPRRVLLSLPDTYNTMWLIERHGFLARADSVRNGLDPRPRRHRATTVSYQSA